MLEKYIFIPVRYPTKNDLKDGYFQRVLAIDVILDTIGYNRIYLSYKRKFTVFPEYIVYGEKVSEVAVSIFNPLHILVLLQIAYKSHSIYLHSIMRIKFVSSMLFFLFARKKIIDLHGAIPEELTFYGKKTKTYFFNKIEGFLVKRTDIIISVSDNLTQHIIKKWNVSHDKFILLPILPSRKKEKEMFQKKYAKSIIYCGGLQKWQQVEKMLSYVNKHCKQCLFTFLVPDPDRIKKLYKNIYGNPFPGSVYSASQKEVRSAYASHNFGLILRDNGIVNQVACPTKLIEYLENGVVPIVDFDGIGDFKKYRYRHVSYKDNLPEQNTWQDMINENIIVVRRVKNSFERGVISLEKII